jgi:ABC-type sugar transport system substrate-binding protein
MKDIIANSPDLRGVFVSDPIMAEAVGPAVTENKTGDKINVVGIGSNKKLVKLLQGDTIAGLDLEDPFRMGYEASRSHSPHRRANKSRRVSIPAPHSSPGPTSTPRGRRNSSTRSSSERRTA